MGEDRNAARRRPRAGRTLRRVGQIALALLLVGGLDYGHWALFRHRLVTVSPGRVYQSAEIPPDELIAFAREHEIRSVVDLRDDTPERVAAERSALGAAGITYHHIPSKPLPAPPTYAAFREVAENDDNLPMLIHCEHGEGRSVLFAAIYRMEEERWSNRAAWRGAARLPPSLRFLERLVPGFASFSPHSRKGRVLLEYEPLRGSRAGAGGGAGDDAGARSR